MASLATARLRTRSHECTDAAGNFRDLPCLMSFHVYDCSSCDRREDIKADSLLLQKEMQERHDEIAIDLEDRSTKKGTPPVPTESGDIRELRGMRSTAAATAASRQRPAPMVE